MLIKNILTKIRELPTVAQIELLEAIPSVLRPRDVSGLLTIFKRVGQEFRCADTSGVITHTGARLPLLALGMPDLNVVYPALLYLYPNDVY